MREAVRAASLAALLAFSGRLVAQAGATAVRGASALPAHTATPTPRTPSLAGSSIVDVIDQPVHAPAQMDFGSIWNGQSARRTLSLTTNAAGYVTVQLPQGPFRVAEFRELGGFAGSRALAQPGAKAVKTRLTYAEGQNGPFQWSLAPNTAIEVDILFQPHFDLFTMGAGPKTATMKVTGPGPRGSWAFAVPLTGFFDGIRINVTFTLAPRDLDPIAPAPSADLTATIVSVDAAGPGTLKATKLPPGVSMAPVGVNVAKGQTVQVPLKLQLSWGALAADGVARDGEITYEFAGGSSKAGFSLAGLPGSLSAGFANRTDCGIASAGAVVLVYPDHLVLEARGDNLDLVNNRRVYFEARSGGKLLAGGFLHFAFGLNRSTDFKRWDSRNLVTNVDFYSAFAGPADYAWAARNKIAVTCRLVDDRFLLPTH
jgi:hypothetical protein